MAEFVAWAKAESNKGFSYATAGAGGNTHLMMEYFRERMGLPKLSPVPYKGSAPAIQDVVGGQVPCLLDAASLLIPFIATGKLRPILVTGSTRHPALPDVPTAQENLPNFAVVNWLGIFAPAKTPKAVIDEINAAIIKVVARPDVQEKLKKVAILPSTMESPAAFQQFVVAEYKRWGDVLKQAKIELE